MGDEEGSFVEQEIPGLEDEPLVFDGCPARHIDDPDIGMWISMYKWLNVHGKMPSDFGIPIKRLDPRYFEAMDLVEWAVDKYYRPKKNE